MKSLITATLFCVSVAIIYEAENGVHTGFVQYRSAASNSQTIELSTGGEIEWKFSLCFDSNTVSVTNLTVTYMNDGGSDTLYIYLDSNNIGQIVTHSQSQGGFGWNIPYDSHIIGPFALVHTVSTHSIKIVAQSTDVYNVEIDKITMYLSTASASVGQCYLNLNGISNVNIVQPIEINDLFVMKDYSINTTCAEEDNILIYVITNDKYKGLIEIDAIDVLSTYPVYFADNPINHRGADFTSCNFSNSNESPGIETTTKLYDNGYLIIESVYISNWWLNEVMTVSVDGGGTVSNAAYWRVTQKLDYDVSDYQQTFVMYQDGNIRLLPHPPSCYGDWIPFGSSVIIGNTISDIQENRPYSSIESVNILRTSNYKHLTVDVKFTNGDSMLMDLKVSQNVTQITAHNISFSNQTGSLATFRSMFVSEYNNDVDSVRINSNSVYDIIQLSNYNPLQGSVFEFGRKCISKHNTLSPDISFIMKGHLITKQPTVNPTAYPTVNPSFYPTTNPTTYPTVNPTTSPTDHIIINVSLIEYRTNAAEKMKVAEMPSLVISCCIIGIFLLFALISYFDAKMLRRNDYFMVNSIITASLEVTDTFLDWTFAVFLTQSHIINKNIGFLIATIGAYIFIIIPILFSIYQLIKKCHKTWRNDDNLCRWITDNGKILYILSILTGSSYTAIEIVNCNALQLDIFMMGLNKQQRIQFNTKRVFGIVCLENIPQVAIQIWYLNTIGMDLIPICSITFSLISIISSILQLFTQRVIIRNQQFIKISFNVIGDDIKSELSTKTNGIKYEIAEILEINNKLIEIQQPQNISNGLKFNIYLFVNNIDTVYDKYIKLIRNETLSDIIKTEWDINNILIRKLEFENIKSRVEEKNSSKYENVELAETKSQIQRDGKLDNISIYKYVSVDNNDIFIL